MTRIKINGIDFTKDCTGLDSLSNTLRPFGSVDDAGRNYTSNLIFTGKAFELLQSQLFGINSSRGSSVDVEIIPDCCGETLKGVIRADSVNYCLETCEIEAQVFQDDSDARSYSCFSSTIVSHNEPTATFPAGFRNFLHPRFNYCVELKPFSLEIVMNYIVQIINVIFFAIVLPIVISLVPLFTLVFAICAAINLIPGVNLNCGNANPLEIADDLFDFIETMNDQLLQCGRKHPSPFLRNYIINACEKCGLQFKSDIINNPLSPYYDTVYYSPFFSVGTTRDYPNDAIVKDNICNLSGSALLEQVKSVYNAEWRIIDGVVIFERKDYFASNTPWIDLDLRRNDLVQKPCLAYKQELPPAAMDIHFEADGIDIAANEAIDRYKDIISWDNGSGRQNGIKQVALPFGMARTIRDNIGMDVFIRQRSLALPLIGIMINNYDDYINMPQHTCYLPKLLIANGSYQDTKIRRVYETIRTGYPAWNTVSSIPAVPNSPNLNSVALPDVIDRVNYPYYCWEGAPGTIYEEFHYIDDPRTTGIRGQFDVTFAIRYNCEDLTNFSFDKAVRLTFNGVSYLCRIDEATVNYSTQTINVKCTL